MIFTTSLTAAFSESADDTRIIIKSKNHIEFADMKCVPGSSHQKKQLQFQPNNGSYNALTEGMSFHKYRILSLINCSSSIRSKEEESKEEGVEEIGL